MKDKNTLYKICKRPLWLILLSTLVFFKSPAENHILIDFEDNSDNVHWELNVGANGRTIPNKWRIADNQGFAGNSKGLYISTLPDTTKCSYSRTSCFTVARRKINLDPGAYTLSYNWIANARNGEGIFIGYTERLVAAEDLISDWKTNASATLLTDYCNSNNMHNGVSTWQSSQKSIQVTRPEGLLYVIWFNRMDEPNLPGGAIDNIELYQGNCPTPANLHFNLHNRELSWTGPPNSSYDITVYNAFTNRSFAYNNIDTTSFFIDNITDEGMYYFYVRTIQDNGEKHSGWVYTDQFVWLKGVRCIDFFDLTPDNSGAAKCFTNTRSSEPIGSDNTVYDDVIHNIAGQIDYGYDNPLSAHTIHYVQGEVDERTGGQLRTIPPGELASVRVNGFWEKAGYHASCIEYDYPVIRGTSDILVLKYAAVLEFPENHSEEEQPRLRLQVLKDGKIIDPCAQGDFRAGFGDTKNWHTIKKTKSSQDSLFWCDWTTIKVSLRNYIGSTLTIRLAAYDCELSGHYGYGYFTLNCESGDMQGTTCGDTTVDHFEAPEGFNYRWYKNEEPDNTLSTNQRLDIDLKDTNIYFVDVINPLKPNCYYTIEADPNPQYPEAEFQWIHKAHHCQNYVDFLNLSHIVRINRLNGNIKRTDVPITQVTWDFGDGSPKQSISAYSVQHLYPPEGGKFSVTCFAEMSDGLCVDSTNIQIEIPNILEYHDTPTIVVCADTFIDSHGILHQASNEITFKDTVDDALNKYGCEAYAIVQYRFSQSYDIVDSLTICQYETFYWRGNGRMYDSSTNITEHFLSSDGCDSFMTLKLTVFPSLQINMPDSFEICLDNPYLNIPYNVISGSLDSVFVYLPKDLLNYGLTNTTYSFDNKNNIHIPLTDYIPANKYNITIEFKNDRCGLPKRTLDVFILYPSDIVIQKDGFIAVQNEKYNGGGYVFESFQWFRNGIPINGATKSFIPIPQNDLGAIYTVRLKRNNIPFELVTCPIQYDAGESWHVYNNKQEKPLIASTTAYQGQTIELLTDMGFIIYSIDGQTVKQHQYDSNRYLTAPTAQGVYLVRFDDGQVVKLIVK